MLIFEAWGVQIPTSEASNSKLYTLFLICMRLRVKPAMSVFFSPLSGELEGASLTPR